MEAIDRSYQDEKPEPFEWMIKIPIDPHMAVISHLQNNCSLDPMPVYAKAVLSGYPILHRKGNPDLETAGQNLNSCQKQKKYQPAQAMRLKFSGS